jgi:hypothetical protein
MATKVSAKEAYTKVEQYGTKKANAEVRVVKNFPMNKHVRQGDVYLTRIEKPADLSGYVAYKDNQIAKGETKGSRHIIAGNVNMFIKKDMDRMETETLGPVIVAEESFKLTHPEHAHFDIPAGTYQVTYQLNFAKQARVRD